MPQEAICCPILSFLSYHRWYLCKKINECELATDIYNAH